MPKKGYKQSEEHRRKLSLSHKGKKYKAMSDKGRENMSNAHKGHRHSEETKRKMSKSHKEGLTKKVREKYSNRQIKLWQNSEYKEKQLKAIFEGYKLRPTKSERQLKRLLGKLFPNEYKYVGDGTFWINGKNPDFINVNGQKKVIELFGDYWHSKRITGLSKKKHLQKRINHFAKYGFKTLIVWECELQDVKSLSRRLFQFCNQ